MWWDVCTFVCVRAYAVRTCVCVYVYVCVCVCVCGDSVCVVMVVMVVQGSGRVRGLPCGRAAVGAVVAAVGGCTRRAVGAHTAAARTGDAQDRRCGRDGCTAQRLGLPLPLQPELPATGRCHHAG